MLSVPSVVPCSARRWALRGAARERVDSPDAHRDRRRRRDRDRAGRRSGADPPARRHRPQRLPGVVRGPGRRAVLPADGRRHRLRRPRAPRAARGAARAHARVASAVGSARRCPPTPTCVILRRRATAAGRSSASATIATPSSPTRGRSSATTRASSAVDRRRPPRRPALLPPGHRHGARSPDGLRRPVASSIRRHATGSSITRDPTARAPARCARSARRTSSATPRPRWRPVPDNPVFVGVFRLAFL